MTAGRGSFEASSGAAAEALVTRLVRQVEIAEPAAGVLYGDLVLPADPLGVVLFAHGSGSGRASLRNRTLAAALVRRGLGTLLVDLLTEAEAAERHPHPLPLDIDEWASDLHLEIDLQARRLQAATAWLAREPDTAALPVGYFGASTGAAAALVTAAREPERVRAVVARGGRLDLAGKWLMRVHAPILMIVGAQDRPMLEVNRTAYYRIRAERELEVLGGAGHLFEEPGALPQVGALAADWFLRYLPRHREL